MAVALSVQNREALRKEMIKIVAIDHIVLRTEKLKAMIEFYCTVLGCQIERETPTETGLTQLRAGSALIDLIAVDSQLGRAGGRAPTETENNMDHFCLLLDTISEEAIEQHLCEHGVEKGEFYDRYGSEGMGRSIYIKDPDGNTVELRSKL